MNTCTLGHKTHDKILVDTDIGKMWVFDVNKYNNKPGEYCPGQDIVSTTIIIQGSWELRDVANIKPILEKGNKDSIVIDFGAHIGWYSIMAAKLGYDVIAIDGDTECLRLLKENAKLHNVENKISICPLWVDKDFEFDIILEQENDDFEIELIKCDLEGSDLYAIKSIQHLLNKTKNLYVEISPAFNSSYPELVDLLTEQGFKAYYPEGKPFDNDYSETQINLRFSK